jgi:tetratricopeptide (TPR) repeat protein
MKAVRALIALAMLTTLACATVVDEREIRRASMHRRLAEAKLQKNSLELAIREFRAAQDLNPKDAEIYFGLAEAYRRKGLLTEAEQTLDEALRLAPDHQDARLNLSVVYLMQDRWPEAIAITTELIHDPTFLRPSRALVNRGWAYYKSGDDEAAKRDLQEALVSDAGNFQAHLNLGLLYLDQGSTLDAMVHFERVLKILERRPPAIFGATEAQARFHLAQAHVKLGQRDRAIAELRMAAERGGSGEWGERSKEYLTALE